VPLVSIVSRMRFFSLMLNSASSAASSICLPSFWWRPDRGNKMATFVGGKLEVAPKKPELLSSVFGAGW